MSLAAACVSVCILCAGAFGADSAVGVLDVHPSAVGESGCDLQPAWFADHMKFEDPDSLLNLDLGGLPVSIGLTNDQVAGLELTTDIDRAWGFQIFTGMPKTPVPDKGIFRNLIYGGKIAIHPTESWAVGMSVSRDNGQDADEAASVDFNLDIGSRVSLTALSTCQGDGWRSRRYSARFRGSDFYVTPVYEFLNPRDDADRFQAEQHRFGFLPADDEAVRVAGSDFGWEGSERLTFGLRARRYAYTRQDEEAFYYAATTALKAPAGSHLDMEVGRMEGGHCETRYTLAEADLVYPDPFGLRGASLNASLRLIDYDQTVHGLDTALRASWGIGFTFLDGRLETRLSCTQRADPYERDDLGTLLSIRFSS